MTEKIIENEGKNSLLWQCYGGCCGPIPIVLVRLTWTIAGNILDPALGGHDGVKCGGGLELDKLAVT